MRTTIFPTVLVASFALLPCLPCTYFKLPTNTVVRRAFKEMEDHWDPVETSGDFETTCRQLFMQFENEEEPISLEDIAWLRQQAIENHVKANSLLTNQVDDSRLGLPVSRCRENYGKVGKNLLEELIKAHTKVIRHYYANIMNPPEREEESTETSKSEFEEACFNNLCMIQDRMAMQYNNK